MDKRTISRTSRNEVAGFMERGGRGDFVGCSVVVGTLASCCTVAGMQCGGRFRRRALCCSLTGSTSRRPMPLQRLERAPAALSDAAHESDDPYGK
jgi:hypothetical protein